MRIFLSRRSSAVWLGRECAVGESASGQGMKVAESIREERFFCLLEPDGQQRYMRQ